MKQFLPISRADMQAQGIEQLDFVYVIGDAYVDHRRAESWAGGRITQPWYTAISSAAPTNTHR